MKIFFILCFNELSLHRFLQELKSLLQEEFGANPLLKKKKQMFAANRFLFNSHLPAHVKVKIYTFDWRRINSQQVSL